MNKKSIVASMAYIFITFILAVVWHIVLFEQQYINFGYFDRDPNFLLGFISILIQGIVLSFLYPYVQLKGTSFIRALKYVAIIGIFFWTSHVLAFVAKQNVSSMPYFMIMETFYLALQFGIYGLLTGFIYRKEK